MTFGKTTRERIIIRVLLGICRILGRDLGDVVQDELKAIGAHVAANDWEDAA